MILARNPDPSPVKVDASGILLACDVKVGLVAPTPISKIIALPAQRGTPSFFSSPTVVVIGLSLNLLPKERVGLGFPFPLATIS
jgi:hypothetical protein